jgi:hypothetical protein
MTVCRGRLFLPLVWRGQELQAPGSSGLTFVTLAEQRTIYRPVRVWTTGSDSLAVTVRVRSITLR